MIEGVSDGLSSFAKLAGGWIADRPVAPQTYRHHRLFRHGALDFRLRLRAHLARSFAVARAGMGRPRQSRPVARHAARRFRRTGASGARLRFRARDGHSRRCARTALRNSAARHARRSRRFAVDSASRPCRGGSFCISRSGRQKRSQAITHPASLQASNSFPNPTGIFSQAFLRMASAILLPRLLILRASQILGPRFGTGRAATSPSPSTLFTISSTLLASYPAGAIGDRIGKRGLARGRIFYRRHRLRGIYFRAAHDYRPRDSLRTGRNSWRVSAVARKIARGGNFADSNSRLGLRSSCHGEWNWRSDLEHCGGRAVVGRKPCGGIRLCGNFYACRSSCNFSLALIQPAADSAIKIISREPAVLSGNPGRNSCSVPRRSRAGSASRSESTSSLCADRRDAASEILPASPSRIHVIGNGRPAQAESLPSALRAPRDRACEFPCRSDLRPAAWD